MPARPTTSPATIAMIVITTSSSTMVNARVELCRGTVISRVEVAVFISPEVDSPKFLLHPFAQPLFNHALVIEIARTRQALDARKHPRIDAQSDGDRFGKLRAGDHR